MEEKSLNFIEQIVEKDLQEKLRNKHNNNEKMLIDKL